LFKNVFFGWLFLHTALLIPFHREIWAPAAFMLRRPFMSNSLYDWIFYISGHPALRDYYLIFVFGQLAVLALGMAGFTSRLINLLACITTLNVNNLSPVILDGGNNLSQLILVYMVFMNTSGVGFRCRFVPVQMAVTAVSNAAFFVCRLQVVMVYICTAIFKLNGPLWQNGMALYYIFQSDAYTHPVLYKLVLAHPWVSLAGSYFTIATQALLPVLVWPRRTRAFILTAATLMHFGISFGMGLFMFGLVMCVMYTLFFTNELSLAIARVFSSRLRLSVTVSSRSPRLVRLLKLIERVDFLGALVLTTDENAELPITAHFDDGRPFGGGEAILLIVAKVIVLLPFLPFVAALFYLGMLEPNTVTLSAPEPPSRAAA